MISILNLTFSVSYDIGKKTLPNQMLASGIFAITALSFAQMDIYTYYGESGIAY